MIKKLLPLHNQEEQHNHSMATALWQARIKPFIHEYKTFIPKLTTILLIRREQPSLRC